MGEGYSSEDLSEGQYVLDGDAGDLVSDGGERSMTRVLGAPLVCLAARACLYFNRGLLDAEMSSGVVIAVEGGCRRRRASYVPPFMARADRIR